MAVMTSKANDNMRRRWGHDWWLGIFLVHPPDRSMARGYGWPTLAPRTPTALSHSCLAPEREREKIWSKSIDAAASCALSSNSESGRRKGPTAFCRKSPPPSCHHLAWGEFASVKFLYWRTGKVDTTLWKSCPFPLALADLMTGRNWANLTLADLHLQPTRLTHRTPFSGCFDNVHHDLL